MPLGGWALSPEVFQHIMDLLMPGATILELGSGDGTAELVKHFNVYSVEHDFSWVGKYHNQYIYAPLTEHKAVEFHEDSTQWYDPEIIKEWVPDLKYDLLLVDGPIGNTRAGLLKYWDCFLHNVPVLFDDVNREYTWKVLRDLAYRTKRSYTVYNHKYPNKRMRARQYGVLHVR